MSVTNPVVVFIFTALFYVSLVLIWFLVAYQLFLTVGGFILHRKAKREREKFLNEDIDYPPMTILVPAHNEEKVIERTLEHLLGLNYPEDRLTVLVIDDASKDGTLEIINRMAEQDSRLRVFHRPVGVGGRGKAAALNDSLQLVDTEYIAIYDADNCPEPNALKLLVARMLEQPELAAVVGKFRTGNKRKNLLTRFINIEGLCFQNVVQSGRWQILGVSALSGTNYIIRKSILKELGSWDEEALAEDSELSVRIYQAGYKIAFIPFSSSWEQEPETFWVWVRQRTRWARGNNYAIAKLVKTINRSKSIPQAIEILFTLCVPYCFLFAICISQLFLFLSLCRIHIADFPAMLSLFWYFALFVYLIEMALVLSYDDETSLLNLFVSFLMYFSYCQMWLVPVLRALYSDCILREKRVWDKTVRFDSEISSLSENSVVNSNSIR